MWLLAFLSQFPSLAQHKGTGLNFDDEVYQQAPIKALLTRGDYTQLPSSASLKQFCPPPGNQLQLNTSVGWAVSYGAMTILKAKQNNWTDPNKILQNAYSPVFSYYYAKPKDDNDCSSPVSLNNLLTQLKEKGAPKFVEFMEFCPNSIEGQNLSKQSITGFSRLFDVEASGEFKTTSVKKALAEGYPVVIGMHIPPSFNTATDFWQPREKFDEKYPGQALCVIGYDNNKYGGALEVMNSWGRNWGNGGFIWIPYKYFEEFTRYAFEIYDVPQNSNADLGGTMDFQLVSGGSGSMPVKLLNNDGDYRIAKSYGVGTQFRIIIGNEATAFVYAFATDASGSVFQIFPFEGTSPVLPYKSNHVAIPSEESVINIDQASGSDFICIIYSREELPIEGIINKINGTSGLFNQKVRTILGQYFGRPAEINFGNDKVEFHGKGRAVAITAEMVYN